MTLNDMRIEEQEEVCAGSAEAIRREIQYGTLATVADEILHAFDWLIGNCEWRYRFCQWAHRAEMEQDDDAR